METLDWLLVIIGTLVFSAFCVLLSYSMGSWLIGTVMALAGFGIALESWFGRPQQSN